MDTDKILEFWNQRADLGVKAGSDDYIGKELEVNALARHIRDGMRVAEFGCGNGMTAITLALKHDIHLTCFDFAPAMIDAARKLATEAGVEDRLDFKVMDVRDERPLYEDFDVVYTQRMIINLSTWEAQTRAIRYLVSFLRRGGHFLMCENSQLALVKLNELRIQVGLDSISPPWHNLYLNEAEVTALDVSGAKLVEVDPFMSTYYFLSRVVNAWLAKCEGKQPAYDAPVNQLALKLPSIGDCSQTKIWVFERL